MGGAVDRPGGVLLEVEERNSPAIRLYEDLGFMVLARRRNYYGSGLDALVMELPLESES